MTDLESLCYESYNLAIEDEDITTASFLLKFIKMLSHITNQCILLVDKGKAYNNDWMRFDHDIADMIILPDIVSNWS